MRAIIVSLAGFLLAPFLAGLAVEMAKPWLPMENSMLGFLLMLHEATAFPWVVAGGSGLLLGLWLDRFSAAYDGRNPLTKRGKAKALAYDVEICAHELDAIIKAKFNRSETARVRAIIIARKLTRLGIRMPQHPDPQQQLYRTAYVFRLLYPALQDGDLKLAKAISRETAEVMAKQDRIPAP